MADKVSTTELMDKLSKAGRKVINKYEGKEGEECRVVAYQAIISQVDGSNPRIAGASSYSNAVSVISEDKSIEQYVASVLIDKCSNSIGIVKSLKKVASKVIDDTSARKRARSYIQDFVREVSSESSLLDTIKSYIKSPGKIISKVKDLVFGSKKRAAIFGGIVAGLVILKIAAQRYPRLARIYEKIMYILLTPVRVVKRVLSIFRKEKKVIEQYLADERYRRVFESKLDNVAMLSMMYSA